MVYRFPPVPLKISFHSFKSYVTVFLFFCFFCFLAKKKEPNLKIIFVTETEVFDLFWLEILTHACSLNHGLNQSMKRGFASACVLKQSLYFFLGFLPSSLKFTEVIQTSYFFAPSSLRILNKSRSCSVDFAVCYQYLSHHCPRWSISSFLK